MNKVPQDKFPVRAESALCTYTSLFKLTGFCYRNVHISRQSVEELVILNDLRRESKHFTGIVYYFLSQCSVLVYKEHRICI